jgi:hypothetical protein
MGSPAHIIDNSLRVHLRVAGVMSSPQDLIYRLSTMKHRIAGFNFVYGPSPSVRHRVRTILQLMKIWARLAIADAMTCVLAYMSGQDATAAFKPWHTRQGAASRLT